ncbi:hypothetical protein AHAS_Ahas18G0088700 [Arachis hypogaea]
MGTVLYPRGRGTGTQFQNPNDLIPHFRRSLSLFSLLPSLKFKPSPLTSHHRRRNLLSLHHRLPQPPLLTAQHASSQSKRASSSLPDTQPKAASSLPPHLAKEKSSSLPPPNRREVVAVARSSRGRSVAISAVSEPLHR